MKTIVIWLAARRITCFNFDSVNQRRLIEAVPDASLIVCRREEEFLDALGEADVALVWRFKQEWFELAPNLKVLSTPAAGHDYCDVVAPAGVSLYYGSFHGLLMAETVVGMLLAASRGILTSAWLQGEKSWPREELANTARPLSGSHLVIMGFGAIGRIVGRMAKPFGLRITGVRRSPGERPDYFDEADRIIPVDEADAILPETDHLVLCLPGNTETDRIIDARRLALLPESAWLYNVGRGNAIDEAALALALERGAISGACLDVYDEEPLPDDSPLRQAPRVLLMPHSSAFSPTYMDRYLDEIIPLLKKA